MEMARSTAADIPHKPFYTHLYVQVLTAIVLGVLLGHFYPHLGEAMKPLEGSEPPLGGQGQVVEADEAELGKSAKSRTKGRKHNLKFVSLIERGGSHHAVWDLLGVRPPARRVEIGAADLYPDALPCLRTLADRGCVLGLAGNQSAETEVELARLGMPVAFIASSARWGVAKPSSAFFDRLMAEVGLPVDRIAYVGDRLDNDVLPARVAGLVSVFVRRGPWGLLHAGRPEAALADITVDSLLELPDRLRPPRPPG